ncbi:hypothetical protein [Blastopirellula marina]|uniref:Carboxypeptidase regulatory-like domain-containing protein n=1 Tax=Blastopirellula marina DSM 3645 TaxID=314230 RepID=A3ZMP4_9BACT|nr:hypothetical protein [Blastopirellula marina]EAQ82217.1 hypothetical protein DSM3645_00845 [Blastopirellula marina DSM 3645]
MNCKDLLALSLMTTALWSFGCGKKEHEYFAKPTVQVAGTVTVDGQPPGSPIVIECQSVGDDDLEHPSVTQALTSEDGRFALSTYVEGDGAPPGSYALTFYWGKLNQMSVGFSGPDRLKNRYNKPEKSPVKLTLTADQEPVDLGEIKLTTK